jgi:hypothetical protein
LTAPVSRPRRVTREMKGMKRIKRRMRMKRES